MLALFPSTLRAQYVYVNANNQTANANTAWGFKNVPITSLLAIGAEPPAGYPSHGTAALHTDALKDQALYTLSATKCLFISEQLASSANPNGDIAAFQVHPGNGHLTYLASYATPAGLSGPYALATGKGTLYASYVNPSNVIASWSINSANCALTFGQQVTVFPLHGGGITGMAESPNERTLVVTYEDGSIESLRTAGLILTKAPCATAITATGFTDGNMGLPAGVDITRDSQYAILGDASGLSPHGPAELETVKLPITCGTVTTDYGGAIGASAVSLGTFIDSDNVWLSPNEQFIYVTNNGPNGPQGFTTATFTEPNINGLAVGCTFGFTNPTSLRPPTTGGFFEPNGIQTALTSGNGTRVYVGEYANPAPAAVGLLDVDIAGCTQEAAASPFLMPTANGGSGQQLNAYPPRPF
jgi:hypothetical protein